MGSATSDATWRPPPRSRRPLERAANGDDRLSQSLPDVVENAASDGYADEGDSQTRTPRRIEGGASRCLNGKLDHKLQRSRDRNRRVL
jgi:hypothetical protein